MTRHLKLTVLSDNNAEYPLLSEWGLSILIETDEKRILLDTGSSSLFAKNAEMLGIDLSSVDFGVLSHAHYDHSDGMDTFFSLNSKAPFLIRNSSRENCFGIEDGALKYIGIRKGLLREYTSRIRYIEGIYEICDDIWLIPHNEKDYSAIARRNDLFVCHGSECIPDSFSHEHSLVIGTEAGLAVFNSCSHTGMSNILEDVKRALSREDVFAYIGGLHLFKMTDDELETLSSEISMSGIKHILTGHCTGDHAYSYLHEKLDERITQFHSGFSCVLP